MKFNVIDPNPISNDDRYNCVFNLGKWLDPQKFMGMRTEASEFFTIDEMVPSNHYQTFKSIAFYNSDYNFYFNNIPISADFSAADMGIINIRVPRYLVIDESKLINNGSTAEAILLGEFHTLSDSLSGDAVYVILRSSNKSSIQEVTLERKLQTGTGSFYFILNHSNGIDRYLVDDTMITKIVE